LVRDRQYDRARRDFEAILKDHPDDAEAHSGVAYVRACLNEPAEATREAHLALLHGGAGDFLILHNVACVYAELAEANAGQEKQYQDLAVDELRRAVELWKREPASLSEMTLIEQEPAFRPSLRNRPDFQKLLEREK
jgi:hypothetical protein